MIIVLVVYFAKLKCKITSFQQYSEIKSTILLTPTSDSLIAIYYPALQLKLMENWKVYEVIFFMTMNPPL
jgi:hypothetical protein